MEKYEALEMETIFFGTDDIITTSCGGTCPNEGETSSMICNNEFSS